MKIKRVYWNEVANCILIQDTSKPNRSSERLQLTKNTMPYFYEMEWHEGTKNGDLPNNDHLYLLDEWME